MKKDQPKAARKQGRFAPRAQILSATCVLAGMTTIALLACLNAVSPPAAALPRAQIGQALPALSLTGSRGSRNTTPPDALSRPDPPGLYRLTYDRESTPLMWTPDGQSLLTKRPGQVVAGQQLFELWTLSTSTGQGHRTSENALYPSVHQTQVAYLRFVDQGRWEVIVADLSGGKPRPLGPAHWSLPPIWVGDSVLYAHSTGQLTASKSPNASVGLGPPLLQQTRARLSYDGRYVAATNGHRLWVQSDRGQTTVTYADQIWGFAWSPVQAQLAYVRSDGGPLPELWVWDAQVDRSWMLAQGELEHFGTPAWSPDGRLLAFVRSPTGNGTQTTGDIWMVHVARSATQDIPEPYPLASTFADEHSPCWSPDGHTLAFALDGDVWIADLQTPDLGTMIAAAGAPSRTVMTEVEPPGETARSTQLAPLGLTAPLTVWVLHDATRNTCRAVPDGQIDEYPFEQYVKQVVPYEIPRAWPTETLRTQAVAARTYGWRKALDRPHSVYSYTVRDSTADQYMCERTYTSTNAAVDATEGQYVAYDGKVIYAFFCAEAGDPTNFRADFPLVPYLRPVHDPVSFGQTRKGHSWGMSQWGAYRWAAWHDWDYQQILCHYYTSATIEPSAAITQPLASLTYPWPGHYVNTDYAYLRANATDDVAVLSVTVSARVTDTWLVLHTDTDASDGWDYVWPVVGYSDTPTPVISLQVAGHDGTGQATRSNISQMGLHRTPPTGTFGISSTQVTTLSVSLSLTATDLSPLSGTIQVSLGNDDWVWQATALYSTTGEIVTDTAARDGSAWHITASTPGVLFGPYTTDLPTGQQYRAYFRLKVPAQALTNALEIAKLDVALHKGTELLGVRYIRGTDFKAGDTYQEFTVDFEYAATGGALEFRVDSDGVVDLWADQVAIASYPVDVSPRISWTLPAREGPVTTTARFVNRAGNVSEQVALVITVTDDSPPGEWRQFQCAGLTCTVQVRDAIAGLNVDSTAYRYSNDGGLSWSNWLSATCSGVNGSHDWETMGVANAIFLPAPADVLIQFRAYDVAISENEGQSGKYAIPVRRIYSPIVTRD